MNTETIFASGVSAIPTLSLLLWNGLTWAAGDPVRGANPEGLVPGASMTFPGLRESKARQAVIRVCAATFDDAVQIALINNQGCGPARRPSREEALRGFVTPIRKLVRRNLRTGERYEVDALLIRRIRVLHRHAARGTDGHRP